MEQDKIKYEDTTPTPQVHSFDIWNIIPLKQLGLMKCGTVVPTATPNNIGDQFQLVTTGGHLYLYVFDTFAYGWKSILVI